MMRLAATVATMLLVLAACGECFCQSPKPIETPYDVERKVREYLKENVRDPSKLEIVAFSKQFDADGCQLKSGRFDEWGMLEGRRAAIYVRYKTLAASNQIETLTHVFLLDASTPRGMVSFPADRFRTGSNADPFSPGFLK